MIPYCSRQFFGGKKIATQRNWNSKGKKMEGKRTGEEEKKHTNV